MNNRQPGREYRQAAFIYRGGNEADRSGILCHRNKPNAVPMKGDYRLDRDE